MVSAAPAPYERPDEYASADRKAAAGQRTVYGDRLPPPATYPQKMTVERRRERSCCCKLLMCLCCLLFLVVLALGILVLVLYLVYKPSVPSISVVNASVQSLNVSTTGTPSFSGTVDLTVQVVNHNKLTIHFDNTTVDIFWLESGASAVNGTTDGAASIPLGNVTLPGFDAGAHSTNNVPAVLLFGTALTSTTEAAVVSAVQSDVVNLNYYVYVKGHINVWGVASVAVEVDLLCSNSVAPSTLTVTSTSCHVQKAGVD